MCTQSRQHCGLRDFILTVLLNVFWESARPILTTQAEGGTVCRRGNLSRFILGHSFVRFKWEIPLSYQHRHQARCLPLVSRGDSDRLVLPQTDKGVGKRQNELARSKSLV